MRAINTVNTQKEQLKHGSFKFGNGPDVMLIVGSCRFIPYLNYLEWLQAGNKFTIHFIDPCNFNWDAKGNRVDCQAVINELETSEWFLGLLKSSKIYIHELYSSYGVFNSFRINPKNIYQFGLQPELDVMVPNFHDIFILFQDFARCFDGSKELFRHDISTIGRLSQKVQENTAGIALGNLETFYRTCEMSDIPEFGDEFRKNWQFHRFFWNNNHVTNRFTKAVFRLLNDKFLKLETTDDFWQKVDREDMYANPHTPITRYDVESYELRWNEPVTDLKL